MYTFIDILDITMYNGTIGHSTNRHICKGGCYGERAVLENVRNPMRSNIRCYRGTAGSE